MTGREFQDYPNEEAMSLEEVALAYKHGGRKPVSQITLSLPPFLSSLLSL